MLLLTAASRRTKAREEGVRHRLRPISRRMVRPQCSAAQKVNHHVVPIDQDKLSHTTTGLKDPVVSSPPVAFQHQARDDAPGPVAPPLLLACSRRLSAQQRGSVWTAGECFPRSSQFPVRSCTVPGCRLLPAAQGPYRRCKRDPACPACKPPRPHAFPGRGGSTEKPYGPCSCRDAAFRLSSYGPSVMLGTL